MGWSGRRRRFLAGAGLTNAERQAKWRLAHGHKKAASDASRPKRALMVTCIPRGPLDLDQVWYNRHQV
jgi:hypothetical protein